jgi:hypothetical protein
MIDVSGRVLSEASFDTLKKPLRAEIQLCEGLFVTTLKIPSSAPPASHGLGQRDPRVRTDSRIFYLWFILPLDKLPIYLHSDRSSALTPNL